MKKYLNILFLVLLVTSCSKDDDPVYPNPFAEIPTHSKFVSLIDRGGDNIKFSYYPNGKVSEIVIGSHTTIGVVYEGEKIKKLSKVSTIYSSYDYEFSYYDDGTVSGFLVYEIADHSLVMFKPIVYNATTNCYNNFLYFYPDGLIKRVVSGNLDRTLVYDKTKIGAFINADQNLITYLLLVDRNVLLWPAYLGKYPCKQILNGQSTLEMNSLFDGQNFIISNNMTPGYGIVPATYTYIQI